MFWQTRNDEWGAEQSTNHESYSENVNVLKKPLCKCRKRIHVYERQTEVGICHDIYQFELQHAQNVSGHVRPNCCCSIVGESSTQPLLLGLNPGVLIVRGSLQFTKHQNDYCCRAKATRKK